VARLSTLTRCPWARGAWLEPYHDREWGVPRHDDRAHLEALLLDGAQAGLSWELILKRRDAYRQALWDFDPRPLAEAPLEMVDVWMTTPGLIHHRGKLASVIHNARAFAAVQAEWGSFDQYVWSWVGGRPVVHNWERPDQVPATDALARAVSRDLVRRGFRFAGPVVVYSYLQGVGVVMDHLVGCYRHAALRRAAEGGEPHGVPV
jgi:DNA-3-methyladenine glycosylase I